MIEFALRKVSDKYFDTKFKIANTEIYLGLLNEEELSDLESDIQSILNEINWRLEGM